MITCSPNARLNAPHVPGWAVVDEYCLLHVLAFAGFPFSKAFACGVDLQLWAKSRKLGLKIFPILQYRSMIRTEVMGVWSKTVTLSTARKLEVKTSWWMCLSNKSTQLVGNLDQFGLISLAAFSQDFHSQNSPIHFLSAFLCLNDLFCVNKLSLTLLMHDSLLIYGMPARGAAFSIC